MHYIKWSIWLPMKCKNKIQKLHVFVFLKNVIQVPSKIEGQKLNLYAKKDFQKICTYYM